MIPLKTEKEIEIMKEGGKKLSRIKDSLRKAVMPGIKASEIENLAAQLIKKERGESSFKLVNGYSWATCINVNQGLVHGIPSKEIVFKRGDVISVDVGMLYRGFHTDTSFTKALEPSPEISEFLETGNKALKRAISESKSGNHVYDISKAIEDTITHAGYSPIKALVGHGVGKMLHEEPQIPCFLPGRIEDSPEIKPGMVLAIEVMYALGSPDVEVASDGWTIVMRDGKISGLFEETVAVGYEGTFVLTS